MSESNSEKLSRLTIMSTGSETWDLSPNDQRAIRFALDEIDRLTRDRAIWKAQAKAGSAVIRKMRTAEQARQQCNP